MELGHFVKHFFYSARNTRPAGKIFWVFRPKIGARIFNFRKRAEETSLLPPQVTYLDISDLVLKSTNGVVEHYLFRLYFTLVKTTQL